MSPTRRPSSVAGLRRAVSQAPANDKHAGKSGGEAAQLATTRVREKPVRITVDLDPDLYRKLNRWAKSAALELDLDRLPVAQVVRGMIRLLDNADVQDDLRDVLRTMQ